MRLDAFLINLSSCDIGRCALRVTFVKLRTNMINLSKNLPENVYFLIQITCYIEAGTFDKHLLLFCIEQIQRSFIELNIKYQIS